MCLCYFLIVIELISIFLAPCFGTKEQPPELDAQTTFDSDESVGTLGRARLCLPSAHWSLGLKTQLDHFVKSIAKEIEGRYQWWGSCFIIFCTPQLGAMAVWILLGATPRRSLDDEM